MVRLSFAHPSRQRLLVWLDATDESSGITEHVDQCERCAERIEELAGQSDADGLALALSLGDALRAEYEPPVDINDRVLEKIRQRQLADREMNVLFGLFSIPKDAVELLLPSDTNEESSRDGRDKRGQ